MAGVQGGSTPPPLVPGDHSACAWSNLAACAREALIPIVGGPFSAQGAILNGNATGACVGAQANDVLHGLPQGVHVYGQQYCVVVSDKGSAWLDNTFSGVGITIGATTEYFWGNTDRLSRYGGHFHTMTVAIDELGGVSGSVFWSDDRSVYGFTVGGSAGPPGASGGDTQTQEHPIGG
jgi:hypothetical protein